ncbi:MAG: polynucleotide adenylyltransferase PcnB [Lentisphaeria bacterium]|nr:polynucleotide adenylyltransferase PcnB [Lentisphaeria bacterium]
MKYDIPVHNHVYTLVATLQEAGYETYIVGGAIRDHLLGRTPKDYDISTAATPEEVRSVFGRRNARIIGKRFRLVHVTMGRELFEVSTFRRAPQQNSALTQKKELPENMILSDNDFGTAEEDAWRRDFTINALFYDPVKKELLDYTGKGLEDIQKRVVRAIGEAQLRFEEDPVRMLRALKLVGQYDFSMDAVTETALFSSLPLLRHAAPSRLSLELEKILGSCYGDRHLQTFHDFGLLEYFLPEIEAAWETPAAEYMLDLLNERNCRVAEGRYRNSVSLAMAAIVLPFVEQELENAPGDLWTHTPETGAIINDVLERVFSPLTLMNRMTFSALRVLLLQPVINEVDADPDDLMRNRSYPHARELHLIRTAVFDGDLAAEEERLPVCAARRPVNRKNNSRHPARNSGKKRGNM